MESFAGVAPGQIDQTRQNLVQVAKRLYVGNLSYKTSWQDLKDHFKQCGNVVFTSVLRDDKGKGKGKDSFKGKGKGKGKDDGQGWSKGCGIVEYSRVEEAVLAIQTLHDSELGGRKIIVREDRDDRDIVSGLGQVVLSSVPAPGTEGAGVPKSNSKGAGKNATPAKRKYEPSPQAIQMAELKRQQGLGGVSKRVYVGNFGYRVSWQDLKDHFKGIGPVVYCDVMLMPNGLSKGCGIVEFESHEAAAQAMVTMTDTQLGGRPITVREDREDRENQLNDCLGQASLSSIPALVTEGATFPKRLPKGVFATPAGQKFEKSPQVLQIASLKSQQGLGGVGKRVYVGNLGYRVSWQDLKDHFKGIGKVVYCDVMKMPNGLSKGCGIVEFETHAAATHAMATMTDTQLGGRPITVREDREDRDNPIMRTHL